MSNPFFEIKDLEQNTATADSSSAVADKFITYHESRINSIKNICHIPKPGEIFFLWTDRSFNAFTFIPYVIRQCKSIDLLIISTYSINQRIIDSLMRYFRKGLIREISILVSDSLRFRMPKVVDIMESLALSNPTVKIHYGWNHSKISLMKCGDDHLVVEGSGNWSENSRHEQYIFLNNKKIFDFRKECIYAVN